MRSGPLPGWMDRPAGRLLSPGMLADAHAELTGLTGCFECHSGVAGTPDTKCLACHEEIGLRMDARRGFHGNLEGRCATCHDEHQGAAADLLGLDRDGFNHDQALFPLLGSHRTVECDDCHHRKSPESSVERFHPLGIAHERCSDCHADVHGAEFLAERDCTSCHGETTWDSEGLRRLSGSGAEAEGFVHARDTTFPLEGQHAGVSCSRCHSEEIRQSERLSKLPPGSGAPSDCAGCHEDPHRGALAASCETCHAAESWDGPRSPFDHADHTDFALDPLHAALACGDCHADSRFQADSKQCAGCHRDAAALIAGRFQGFEANPDPHRRIGCQDCHGTTLESTSLLAYERACVGCHTDEYGALLLTWTRLRDALVVETEALVKKEELSRRRGEPRRAEIDLVELAARVRRLARSGLHHAELAEAILLAELTRLSPARGEER